MIRRLNREEILRYLGYKDSGVTERMEQLLNRCEAETLKILQSKYIYRRFPIEKGYDGIRIPGTALVLFGNDIQEHLKNCNEIFLLGATAGVELDKRIRRYMVTEPDVGVVMDSCGIQAVEQIADLAEKEMEQEVSAEDILKRFPIIFLLLHRNLSKFQGTHRKKFLLESAFHLLRIVSRDGPFVHIYYKHRILVFPGH